MSEPAKEPSSPPKPFPADPRHLASVVVQRVGRTPLLLGGTVLLLVLWTGAFLLSTSKQGRSAKPPAPPPSADQQAPGTRELLQRFLEEARRQEAEEAAARADRYPSERPGEFSGFAPPAGLDQPQQDEAFAAAEFEPRESPRAARQRNDPPQRDPAKDRLERALEAPPLVALSRPSGARGFDEDSSSRVDLLAPERHAQIPPPPSSQADTAPASPAAVSSPASPLRLRLGSSVPLLTLSAGSLIPAVLTSAVNSDTPGTVSAVVSHDVFDSLTGRSLLVPAGSRLLGTSGTATQGQSRLEIVWRRLTLPDGATYELGQMPAADPAGSTGLRARVNRHLVRTFGSALLLSAFTAAAQLSQPDSYGGTLRGPSAQEVAAGALGQQINATAGALIDRELRIPPTLTIRPGTACNVVVTADLVFPEAFGR